MFETYLQFLRFNPIAHSIGGIILTGYITSWVVMFLGWYFKRPFFKRYGSYFINSPLNQVLMASTFISFILVFLTGKVLVVLSVTYGTLGAVCVIILLLVKLCCVMIDLRDKIPEE